MSANSLNKLKEIPITSDIIKSIEECTSDNSSESLLDAEKLINYEDKLAEHLTVYDEPVITPPSEHIEYPGGIPPYEIQAQIVFDNFINNNNRVMSGKEKRRLRRECLKNAKKGKYMYMFDPVKIQKRQERVHQNFDKINKS